MVKQLMKPKEGYSMMRRLFGKKTYIVFGILCCMFIWLQFGMESYAFTRTTGEVTGSSVKVRKDASTESEMVASVKAGDDLDVVDSVTGADGKVWYKIIVKADEYGYIRSDFVTLASGEQSPSTGTTTTTTTTTDVTPMAEQKGHTSTNNVKVRKQATTGSEEVDRLSQDQIFTISGSAEGPDGKTWYYVSYIDGGASKKGFIRSDLVTIMEDEEDEDEPIGGDSGETVIVDDEEDKPNIPAPTTNYEAVYTDDGSGNYVWYLYDRTAGQRYKIDQFLKAATDKQTEIDDLSSANFGLKIGLVITICLLVMLGVAIAFYIFKMKEEQESASYKKPARPANAKPQSTVRTQNVSGTRTTNTVKNQNQSRPQSNVRPQTLAKPQNMSGAKVGTSNVANSNAIKSETAVRPKEQSNKLSWKAKNFLEDNDELEFGFLDFDDDDE